VSPLTISFIAFACVFGGTLAGGFLHIKLLGSYLDEDAKDAIKLGLGVMVMMSALVLSFAHIFGKKLLRFEACSAYADSR